MWEKLNSISIVGRRRKYWEDIRRDYNSNRTPTDLLFLSKTCYNSVIKYADNDIISSYHFSKKGIEPKILEKVIFNWYRILNEKNVIFNIEKYTNVISGKSDFMYITPSLSVGKDELTAFLEHNIKGKWALYSKESGKLLHNS